MSQDQAPTVPPLVLQAIHVRRVRSLDDVGPLAIQSGMTVVAGQNDGGKSSLIDALEMLLRGVAVPLEARTHDAAQDESIEVEGVLYELADGEQASPVRIRSSLRDGHLRREVMDRVHKGFGDRPGALALNDLRKRSKALGIDSPGGQTKPPYVDAARAWLSTRPPDEFEELWRVAAQDELRRLPTLTTFRSTAAQDPVSHIRSVISREAQRLIGEQEYDGQLSEIGRRIDEDIAPALERMKATIAEYCPGLDSAEINAQFDFSRASSQVYFGLRRDGNDVGFSQLGEGQRRRITLAIHAAELESLQQQGEGGSDAEFIAYDEPDTHLDYSSQRDLFDILTSQSELGHVQVLVATHSTNFIDKIPLPALLHLRLDDARKTQVEQVQTGSTQDEVEFFESLASGIGLRNSSLLGERCFLVVEGPSEERALPILYRKVTGRSLLAHGIGIVNVEGSGAVRRIVEILVLEWRRPVAVLVDNDTRTSARIISAEWLASLDLTEGNELFYVGTKEFEDAFSDDLWLRLATERFETEDGEGPWSIDEFAELRGADLGYGKSLEALFSRRCRRWVSKPELAEAIAKTVVVDEIPAVLQDCIAKLRTIVESD